MFTYTPASNLMSSEVLVMDYVVFVSLSSPFIFKILTTPKPQIFQFPTVLRPSNIPPIFTL